MSKLFAFALLVFSCFGVLAQEPTPATWTDKNNSEMSAGYMLRIAYYERGYMAANITVNRIGKRDVYTVVPGPIFHFKDIIVSGLSDDDRASVMRNAPKSGEVYSAARVNDWIKEVRSGFAAQDRQKRVVEQEMRLDRATASATVRIRFE